MTIHESAENYLETILKLREQKGQVRSIDIAADMGFSKPSISVAMKKLRESGHVEMDNSGLLTLPGGGHRPADLRAPPGSDGHSDLPGRGAGDRRRGGLQNRARPLAGHL